MVFNPSSALLQSIRKSILSKAVISMLLQRWVYVAYINFIAYQYGLPPILIAERIDDTVEMVNWIYGHLYPSRHREVADQLEKLIF